MQTDAQSSTGKFQNCDDALSHWINCVEFFPWFLDSKFLVSLCLEPFLSMLTREVQKHTQFLKLQTVAGLLCNA